MSKAGFRIFDADAHVSEPPEIIEQYIESAYKEKLLKWKVPGAATYRPNYVTFSRVLGDSPSAENTKPVARVTSSPRHRQKPLPNTNTDPKERITDMNQEGIDAGMILPTGVGSFCSVDDLGLEMAVIKAYHRFMSDFCKAYPARLHGVAVVSARNIDESVAELKRVANEPWAVGIFPSLPPGMPLDDPALDPLWAAANDLDMTISLHTFTVIPPYAPGALDGSYFNNYWLARSAAHPWCGMRNMAALLGCGMLDRHKKINIALLEAGQGWLPYWVKRLDEQAAYSPAYLPPTVRPAQAYIDEGRYFQSIEVHEGESMTKYVIDQMGEDMLMFSTDYPHGETWFPETVDTFLGWKSISDDVKRKMFWDNAKRCFPRIGG